MTRQLPPSFWLRHPIKASTATFLAKRSGEGVDSTRTCAELAHESRGMFGANRIIRRRCRRIGKWADQVISARDTVSRRCADAAADRPRVDGDQVTVTSRQAHHRLVETEAAIARDVTSGATVHDHHRGRLGAVLGYLLLAVDAVALFVVFTFLLNVELADPEPTKLATAVAFALFGAGVQAKLAAELGRRIWSWRNNPGAHDEFPPRGVVLLLSGGGLLLISALTALSIFVRIRVDGVQTGELGLATSVGLVLAGCALAAPWVLVQQHAYDGSRLTKRVRSLTAIILRDDADRRRALRDADQQIGRARRLLARAERELRRAQFLIGRRFLRAQRAIVLARGLADATTAHRVPVVTPPHSLLPLGAPVDLEALTAAVAQAAAAVEEARAIRAAVTTQPPHRDWVNGGSIPMATVN